MNSVHERIDIIFVNKNHRFLHGLVVLGRIMAEVINECDVVVIGAGPGGGEITGTDFSMEPMFGAAATAP